jgi:DNA-binding protein H-NS
VQAVQAREAAEQALATKKQLREAAQQEATAAQQAHAEATAEIQRLRDTLAADHTARQGGDSAGGPHA